MTYLELLNLSLTLEELDKITGTTVEIAKAKKAPQQ
jgi:hypothetical protein